MTRHAPLSPSGSSRWLNCPHSLNYKEVDSKPSVYAQEGTRLHAAAAAALSAPPWDESSVDDQIGGYVEYVNGLCASCAYDMHIEYKLELSDLIWGTADCILINNEELIVIDLKTGFKPVKVTGNTQLMLYLLMAGREFGARKIMRAVIYQHGQAASVDYSMDFLEGWYEFCVKPIEEDYRSGKMFVDFSAGDHCKYCPAAGRCRANILLVELLSSADHSVLLSDSQLEAAKYLADSLADAVKSINAELAKRLSKPGHSITKYTLGKRTGRTKIIDNDLFVEKLELLGRDDLLDKKPVSLTKIKKALGEKVFKEELQQFTEPPQVSYTVVKA